MTDDQLDKVKKWPGLINTIVQTCIAILLGIIATSMSGNTDSIAENREAIIKISMGQDSLKDMVIEHHIKDKIMKITDVKCIIHDESKG